MPPPNANPSPCGGISVACCANLVPESLVATFSVGACGFSIPVGLVWDSVSSSWMSFRGSGCQGAEVLQLTCSGTSCSGFTLSIGGASGCIYTISLSSCACDPFQLVFAVTQGGIAPGSCPCCANGTQFTVTIQPAR